MKLASCDNCCCVMDVDKAEGAGIDRYGNVMAEGYQVYDCPVCDEDITVDTVNEVAEI